MKSIAIIHVSLEQVEVLESIFSILTKGGWIIPQWLRNMRRVVDQQEMQDGSKQ